MSFRGIMEYKGIVPGTTVPAIRRARKEALRRMLATWKAERLPEHFTLRAKTEYGYQPRTAEYQKRKARRKHHQIPLVYSGETKRQATEGGGRISGTSKRARLWFRVPYYVYINPSIDLVAELTAMSDKDTEMAHETLDRETENVLRQLESKFHRVVI